MSRRSPRERAAPLHPNPDVAEVISNNRDACEHPDMYVTTVWRGGMTGRIGGSLPYRVWYCPACDRHVRDWSAPLDDPKMKAFLDRLAAMPPPADEEGRQRAIDTVLAQLKDEDVEHEG